MSLAPAAAWLLALGAAALQVGLASRWPGAEDHLGAVALGWAGAIGVAWNRRPPQGGDARDVIAGTAALAAVCALAIHGAGSYHWSNRLLPLGAGLAIALTYSGARRVPTYGRELTMLAVPLLQPLPGVVQRAVMPLRETASTAAGLLSAVGFRAEAIENLVVLPDARLQVQEGCSGLSGIAQLLALAVLLLVLFPTNRLQKLLVVASAVVVGFAVNVVRVAFLAVVASTAPDEFAYYERYGIGSLGFPVVAAVVAAAAWWAILRLGRRDRARTGAATPAPPGSRRHGSDRPGRPFLPPPPATRS